MHVIIELVATAKLFLDRFSDAALRIVFRASFAGDGLAVFGKSQSFFEKDGFSAIVRKHARSYQDASRIWRLHTLCWAARRALLLEGDFVECGVFKGFFSSVVCDFLSFGKVPRTFWLFDTFEGFSTKYTSAADFGRGQLFLDVAQRDYRQGDIHRSVQERFSSYPNVEVIKGVLPDALDQRCPGKIAYLHIDLNSPRAEYLTLERLYPLVVPGGVIVFDDYGWENFRKQEEAVNQFFAKTGETVLELPTGQGLVIKRG